MKQVPITQHLEPGAPPGAAQSTMQSPIVVRTAEIGDVPKLVAIETRCFETDRVSARSFRHLLRHAHSINLVATVDSAVVGYVTVLLRKGSHLARVYSLAVDPQWQGRGIGTRVLEAAEGRAAIAGCRRLRLEVRTDNDRAVRQYERAGYVQIGEKAGYYEDGETALRFEKHINTAGEVGAC
jgi:ribosomal protein S18 acetylase RimI-like enzyme